MLAQRSTLTSLQEVADVTVGVLVFNRHLVAAPAAPDIALQQRRAVARHAACLVADILRVVVAQHGLDPLEIGPFDVGRIRSFTTTFHSVVGQRVVISLPLA